MITKDNKIPMEEACRIADAMETYGGGFVQCLGRALRQADVFNRQKIKHAWPEYWSEYKKIAEKHIK